MKDHAFSDQPVAEISKPAAFDSILERLALVFDRIMNRFRFARIGRQFRKSATLHGSVKAGPKAVLVNFGAKEDLEIGTGSICRGLIRIGDFGPAKLCIEENVYIGDGTIISCTNKIKIGSNTLVAHNVEIFDNDSHPVETEARLRDWNILLGITNGSRVNIASAPIEIGKNVWIGAGAKILKGVKIGDGVIVSAGSIVTCDLPAECVAAGNPARIVKEAGSRGKTNEF